VIEIAKIIEASGIAGLRPEWEELWQRDPAATPFQSPAWLEAWWDYFGTSEPLVLTARCGAELVGLLPLYLLREPGCRKLLPIGVGLSDHIDALIDPIADDGVVDLLIAAVAQTQGWDECWLPDLAAEGKLAGAAGFPGVTSRTMPAPPCPVLGLPADPSRLGEVVPRKTLRDLHQVQKRAMAAGGIVIEAIADGGLDAALDDLFRLHEQRWRGRGESGVCGDPLVQAFHRKAAHRLQAVGMLRLYRLLIGDRVAAVYYGFVAKSTAYAYLGGFDLSQPRLSPGTQIIAYAIEQAIAEGVARFDFLRGDEAYKYAWGAVDRHKISLRLSWQQCTAR